MLQVFNEFNSRKLQRNELNLFEGLFNNSLFWLIIMITFIVQFLMIEFGGRYVGVSGLTLIQHGFCIVVGAGSIGIGLVIKILPNFLFNKIKLFREEEMDLTKIDNSFTSMMRRKSSVRMNNF